MSSVWLMTPDRAYPFVATVSENKDQPEGFKARFGGIRISNYLDTSAQNGGKRAYEILLREGYAHPKTNAQFSFNNSEDKETLKAIDKLDQVNGESADLAFALATFMGLKNYLAKQFQIPELDVAATGRLNDDYQVLEIGYLPAKIQAIFEAWPTEGGLIFFPTSNIKDISPDIASEALRRNIKLCPITHLDEAFEQLGVKLEKIYTKELFRGLAVFGYEHRNIYFGRQEEIVEIRKQLLERERNGCPGLIISGGSGTGKSSLVQAGVLPALIEPIQIEKLDTLIERPVSWCLWRPSNIEQPNSSANQAMACRSICASWTTLWPLEALASEETYASLIASWQNHWPAQQRFVWVIDQLEELFSLGFSKTFIEEFSDFLQALQQQGVWIIATLRSDFFLNYEKSSLFDLFGNNAQYSLKTLDEKSLRQIIEQPVVKARLIFERNVTTRHSLDDQLLADIQGADNPSAALPLLEYCLDALYQDALNNGDTTLRFASYENIGGRTIDAEQGPTPPNKQNNNLFSAIGRKADQVLNKFCDDKKLDEATGQVTLSRLLFHLATPQQHHQEHSGKVSADADEMGYLARPCATHTFEHISAEGQLIYEYLIPERLLMVDNHTLRVAHEALFNHWKTAKTLLTQNIKDLRTRSELEQDLARWQHAETEKAKNSLLIPAGVRLDNAEGFLKRQRENIQHQKELIDYIEASGNHQLKIQKKKTRFLQVISVVLLFLIIMSGWMFFLQRIKTLEAREQSALRTPSNAENLLKQGNLDSAILLLMDAINVFEGKELPDSLAISMHNILEAAALRTQYEIGQPALLMSVNNSFYIVGKENGDLYHFDGTHKPQFLLNIATNTDSQIIAAKYRQDRNKIILVHDNLQYDVFNIDNSKIISSGQLPEPRDVNKEFSVKKYIDIQDDGLVSVQWVDAEDATAINIISLSIFDIDSGASYSNDFEDIESLSTLKIIKKSNKRYLADVGWGGFLKRILWKGKTLVLVDPEQKYNEEQIKLLGCTSETSLFNNDQIRSIRELIKTQETGGNDYSCQSIGERIFLASTSCGSGGCFRQGQIVDESGKFADDGEYSSENIRINLPVNNPEAIAVEATSQLIAVAENRSIKVYEMSDLNFDITNDTALWHETTPNQVRFLTPNIIMSFEESIGRITLHTLKTEPFRTKVFSTLDENNIPKPLNYGTCNSVSELEEWKVNIPNFGKLQLQFDSSDPNQNKKKLLITDINGVIVIHSAPFQNDVTCVQVSADLSDLILVMEQNIQVYSLSKIQETNSLVNSLKYSIPISGATSAFPMNDGSLLITKGTPELDHWSKDGNGKWSKSVMYRGQYPLEYAEPDRGNNRIILSEDTGGREMREFVYSITSRSEWLTIVEDYKISHHAFFTQDGGIVFENRHGESVDMGLLKPFLSGYDFLKESRQELSDQCITGPNTDPSDSLCWRNLILH